MPLRVGGTRFGAPFPPPFFVRSASVCRHRFPSPFFIAIRRSQGPFLCPDAFLVIIAHTFFRSCPLGFSKTFPAAAAPRSYQRKVGRVSAGSDCGPPWVLFFPGGLSLVSLSWPDKRRTFLRLFPLVYSLSVGEGSSRFFFFCRRSVKGWPRFLRQAGTARPRRCPRPFPDCHSFFSPFDGVLFSPPMMVTWNSWTFLTNVFFWAGSGPLLHELFFFFSPFPSPTGRGRFPSGKLAALEGRCVFAAGSFFFSLFQPLNFLSGGGYYTHFRDLPPPRDNGVAGPNDFFSPLPSAAFPTVWNPIVDK